MHAEVTAGIHTNYREARCWLNEGIDGKGGANKGADGAKVRARERAAWMRGVQERESVSKALA